MKLTRDELARQYAVATRRVALLDRSDRALIEVGGPDRATWLNNLVTNVIKTLAAGEGNYAFAVNIKGRVLFDMNMLVVDDPARPDGRLWLEIDAGWTADALKHLNRYIIAENVKVTEVTSQFSRWAILGPRAPAVVERLGLGNLSAMASLQHVARGDGEASVRMVRHDFAGPIGAEFIVSSGGGSAWRETLLDAGRAAGIEPIGAETADVLRIEAGIPASRRDIDADTLPPETNQIERGISYHKGCYLGQEVIERMRSHGVVPRKLVGLKLASAEVPPMPATVIRDGSDVGRATSACWSFVLGAPLALGLVKTAHLTPDVKLAIASAGGTALDAQVVALPATATR